MSDHIDKEKAFKEVMGIKRHSLNILKDASIIAAWLTNQPGLDYTKSDLASLIDLATSINDDFNNILNVLNANSKNDDENQEHK